MLTVLAVDDDPKFLGAVEDMLATAGYRVLRAVDGNQAVALLEKKHQEIDLAIVDLALPGINGFEIIGSISRRPNRIKVIATTSIYKDVNLEMVRAMGAHAAIRKPPEGQPLPVSEWLGTIQRLIGAPPSEQRANAAQAQEKRDDSEG